MKTTSFIHRVEMLNLMENYKEVLWDIYQEKLTPLIGKKVFAVDGGFIQKYKHLNRGEIKGRHCGNFFSITHYFKTDGQIRIRISYNGGSYDVRTNFSMSEESHLYLVEINAQGIITKVIQDPYTMMRFNADIIYGEFEKLQAIGKQYREQMEKVPHQLHDILYVERLTRH